MSKRCFTKIALLKRWNFGIILHFVYPLTLHTANNVFLFFDFWDSEPVILKITVFKGTFSMLGIKRKGKTSKTYGTRLTSSKMCFFCILGRLFVSILGVLKVANVLCLRLKTPPMRVLCSWCYAGTAKEKRRHGKKEFFQKNQHFQVKIVFFRINGAFFSREVFPGDLESINGVYGSKAIG